MDEAASKRPPSQPEPAPGKKKRPRYESQKRYDKKVGKTRVNLGVAFNRWRQVRKRIGFKYDAQLATFLLNQYEYGPQSSTPRIGSSNKHKKEDKAASELDNASTPHRMLAQLEWSPGEMNVDYGQHEDEGPIGDIRNGTLDWSDDSLLERAIKEEDMDNEYEEEKPSLSTRGDWDDDALPERPIKTEQMENGYEEDTPSLSSGVDWAGQTADERPIKEEQIDNGYEEDTPSLSTRVQRLSDLR